MNHWLENLFKKKDSSKKGMSYRYIAIVLALGVALMVVGNFFSNGDPKKAITATKINQPDAQSALGHHKDSGPSSMIEYEQYYENQLRDALENIYGVSSVIVRVNVTTSKTKIVQQDKSVDSQTTTEQDQRGGTRETNQRNENDKTVIINGDNGDHPLIIGTKQPQIEGVTVIAGGAQNAQVRLWITEAVHSLLGVPEYRIAVIPKKQRRNES
ncbi:MAG TPA: stage III sporulation protein AG [Bacillales bacterium]|nr:stage III sporulation protein AG [Bacillales bacterium]